MAHAGNRGKLPAKTKLGYAVGQLTDSIGFNVFYVFFLFFLTDYAGIPPGLAGLVVLISVIWDALADPIVGQISDSLNSRWGRRRPLMLAGVVPYGLCMFLLFTNVDMEPTAKAVYFTCIAIVFWSCYKIFVIPHFALGAEITSDFNERTALRIWASFFLYFATILTSAFPLKIVDICVQAGATASRGWSVTGLVLGFCIIGTGIYCWAATKGGELELSPKERSKGGGLRALKELPANMLSLLRLSPSRYLAVTVFLWAVVFSMTSGGIVYLMSSNLHYSTDEKSLCLLAFSLFGILWLPLVNRISSRFDKQVAITASMFISGVACVAFYLVGFPGMGLFLVFLALVQLGNSAFWTLSYSMMYDISELDEFVNARRREGGITALMSFVQKLGGALAVWGMGVILGMGGYDGMAGTQSDSALQSVLLVNTVLPGIIGIAAAVAALLYPLNRKRFTALVEALKAKRENREYSTAGFEKLL